MDLRAPSLSPECHKHSAYPTVPWRCACTCVCFWDAINTYTFTHDLIWCIIHFIRTLVLPKQFIDKGYTRWFAIAFHCVCVCVFESMQVAVVGCFLHTWVGFRRWNEDLPGLTPVFFSFQLPQRDIQHRCQWTEYKHSISDAICPATNHVRQEQKHNRHEPVTRTT